MIKGQTGHSLGCASARSCISQDQDFTLRLRRLP